MNNKVLLWKCSVTVSSMNFTDQIQELICYIRTGYLHYESDIPNERALMNALCRNECAPLRKDNAKTHKRPEGPMDHFKSEMFTIEDGDQGSATHTVFKEN